MFLAYIDESGDKGPLATAGSRSFTLGCVLVRATAWPSTFDALIGFRRFLFKQFGLPVRAEIKANHLLRNAGAFRDLALSESARHAIYRGSLRLQAKLSLSAFAIVINKAKLRAGVDPHGQAWTFMFQRLERLTTPGDDRVLVIHDEGDRLAVRKLARKARRAGMAGRAFGPGALPRPFKGLVDDPVPRDSQESCFLQLADLVAYAAFRRAFPPPVRPIQIVPELMWEELGAARYAPANSRVGGPSDGIVFWPR